MTTGKYVLGPDNEAIPEPDLHRWAAWFETADRRIAGSPTTIDAFTVSTVFLAIDHAWGADPPQLWETMVFGEATERCWRYATYAEALIGHEAVCRMLRESAPEQRVEIIHRRGISLGGKI